MTALQELIQIIKDFTPEQMREFIKHPITVNVLGGDRETERGLAV